MVRLPRNKKQTYRLNSEPQMWPSTWPWPWPWLWIFKVNFGKLLYLSQRWFDCQKMKSKHIEWTEGLNNNKIWPWSWPWKVRCKDVPDSNRGDFRCPRAVDSSRWFYVHLPICKQMPASVYTEWFPTDLRPNYDLGVTVHSVSSAWCTSLPWCHAGGHQQVDPGCKSVRQSKTYDFSLTSHLKVGRGLFASQWWRSNMSCMWLFKQFHQREMSRVTCAWLTTVPDDRKVPEWLTTNLRGIWEFADERRSNCESLGQQFHDHLDPFYTVWECVLPSDGELFCECSRWPSDE